MKALILDTAFARETEASGYRCIGKVLNGRIEGTKFVTRLKDNEWRFWEREYQVVPPELENEPIEVIKLWAAL